MSGYFEGFEERVDEALAKRVCDVYLVEVKPLSEFHKQKLLDRLERVRLGLKEELRYWKEVERNGKTYKK